MINVKQYTKGEKVKREGIIPTPPTRFLLRKNGDILNAYTNSDLSKTGPIKIN